MAVLTKIEFENALMKYNCCDVLHPWSKNCLKGNIMFTASCLLGGLKFLSIMYTAAIIFKLKAKKKLCFKKEFKEYMRSLTHITIFGAILCGGNCISRKVLGKYSYFMVVYIIPFLSGVPSLIESRGRTVLNSTTFLTGALEGLYRRCLNQGILRKTKFGETLIFMLLNGSLMYSLRKEPHDSIWFFTPSKIKYPENNGPQKECSHKGVCTRSLLKDVFTYGGIALLISSLKIIILNFKNPSRLINQFFTWPTWKFASFVGSYIGIFKVVSCYLCQTRGDSLLNTYIAGLLAGLSYSISPKITVLFSTLTALLKIIGSQIKKKCNLPNLAYLEITFILSLMYLIKLMILDVQNCPTYIYKMARMVSSNKIGLLVENIHDILGKRQH